MKKFIKSNCQTRRTFLFAIVISTLYSCDPGKLNDKAVETSNHFYNHLQRAEFDSSILLCSKEGLDATSKQDWLAAFKKNAALLGKIKSFTKTSGFNISTSTSTGTTVAVAYDVKWEFGDSRDSLWLVKEKDGSMKVYRYTWIHSNAKYIQAVEESEKLSDAYLKQVQAKNYSAALNFIDPRSFEITKKDQWINLYESAVDKKGEIASYKIDIQPANYFIRGDGGLGFGNYYEVFASTMRRDEPVMEKLVFFQKDYSESVKLIGHHFLK